MALSLKIAVRYLFSKKSHSVINIISMVSVCGVALSTLALVCTLSIYNGFETLIGGNFSILDPAIKITPVRGKVLDTSDERFKTIASWPQVEMLVPVIEENALVVFKQRQMPAMIKGVPENYNQLTSIDKAMLDGSFMIRDPLAKYTVLGAGLATYLGTGPGFVSPLYLYVPKRKAAVSMVNPMSAFRQERLFVAGVFATNAQDYDQQLMIIPIEMARELLDYTTEASALELKISSKVDLKQTQKRIEKFLGDEFKVLNRWQQQETEYRMVAIEKWITFLILTFILMIASFNVISSLSMLILDKQGDIRTLQSLGASNKFISRLFFLEGWLISAIGAGTGVILGTILCLLQQEFGFLKMGQAGMFVVDAYPVQVLFSDLLAVIGIVLLMGFFTAWYPVRYLKRRWLNRK